MQEHQSEPESEGRVHVRSHLLIMALCCLIPVAIVVVLVAVSVEGFYVPFLLVLLCPLMMVLVYLQQSVTGRNRRTLENQN